MSDEGTPASVVETNRDVEKVPKPTSQDEKEPQATKAENGGDKPDPSFGSSSSSFGALVMVGFVLVAAGVFLFADDGHSDLLAGMPGPVQVWMETGECRTNYKFHMPLSVALAISGLSLQCFVAHISSLASLLFYLHRCFELMACPSPYLF